MLTAAVLATAVTWAVFRVTELLPRYRRIRALVGAAEPIVDLAVPVDDERDHIRGPAARSRHASSSTPISSARTAARPSRSCASCSPTSATCGTYGAICR